MNQGSNYVCYHIPFLSFFPLICFAFSGISLRFSVTGGSVHFPMISGCQRRKTDVFFRQE